MATTAATSMTKPSPIRVRGKNMRRPSDDEGRASASPTRSASPSASAPKRQRTGNEKTPYESFEQRLPLKVVESIYIYSENVNLSLCNRRLYWMLSRRRTRVEMALAAFRPAWDADWAEKRPKHRQRVWNSTDVWTDHKDAGRDAKRPGDPFVQTALLQCPWVDVPLLLEAEQLWAQRTFCRGGDEEAALGVPQKMHVVIRRPTAGTASLAREFRLNVEQAAAIEKTHRERGCTYHGHDWITDEMNDEHEEIWDDDDDDDYDDERDDGDNAAMWAGVSLADLDAADAAEDARRAGMSQAELDAEGERVDPAEMVRRMGMTLAELDAEDAAAAAGKARAPKTQRLPSAQACFAYEALNATFNLSKWHEVQRGDPSWEMGYNIEDLRKPLVPCNGKHRYVHPRTVIPERLLLAAGAPAAADLHARMDVPALEASRTELQRTYELLLWLVLGGARLQPTDKWEVTVAGHRRLLALAAADARTRPRQWHAFIPGSPGWERADVEAQPPDEPAPATSAGAATPIGLSLDALCLSMLALYQDLGVYTDQWPDTVFDEQDQRPADRDSMDDAYRGTWALCYVSVIGGENYLVRKRRERASYRF